MMRSRGEKNKRKLFCGASQAAIALHSWAVKISHIADACISSVCLSCHISNSWLRVLIHQRTGVYSCECTVPLCTALHCGVCVCVWGLTVCGIWWYSRQRESSLKGSRSGYYLCSAFETGTELEASIICGSTAARSHLRCSRRQISGQTARLNEYGLIENWNIVCPCADSCDRLDVDGTKAKHLRRQKWCFGCTHTDSALWKIRSVKLNCDYDSPSNHLSVYFLSLVPQAISIMACVFLSAALMLPIMFSSLFNFRHCQQVLVSLVSPTFPFLTGED